MTAAATGILKPPMLGVAVFHQIGNAAQFNQWETEMCADPGNSRAFHVFAHRLMLPGELIAPLTRTTDAINRDKGPAMEGDSGTFEHGYRSVQE